MVRTEELRQVTIADRRFLGLILRLQSLLLGLSARSQSMVMVALWRLQFKPPGQFLDVMRDAVSARLVQVGVSVCQWG